MRVEDLFFKTYHVPPTASEQAFGRVNLIGEHIDYNGGTVLPTVINRQVEISISLNEERSDQILSNIFNDSVSRAIDQVKMNHWSDYVVGALNQCRQLNYLSGGVKVAIQSNIPHGGGVSSSTAVIIATIRAVLKMQNIQFDPISVAQWAQQVEQNYIGMPCGIMDQMAISIGVQNRALALDTVSLDYSLVDLSTDFHFAVLNSGITRQLNDGRYKVRRDECDAASKQLGVEYLCLMDDANYQMLGQLPLTLQKRARHAYHEQRRVLQFVDALKDDNIEKVGQLMDESHVSMKDEFEVSTVEIDAMVASAKEHGAIGARLTGGGFGGCIVACVAKSDIKKWAANMKQSHPNSELIC